MTVTDLSLVVPSRAHFGHERHCSLVSVIRAKTKFDYEATCKNSLPVLEDETGDADALSRGAVPLDGPPAKGVRWVPLGKLDAVGEVDGVDTAADEEVGGRGAGGERGLDVLVVAALELPSSSAASLGRNSIDI